MYRLIELLEEQVIIHRKDAKDPHRDIDMSMPLILLE
jgi:hypothetical protein